MTAAADFNPPPNLRQGPKKRAAPVVKVCPKPEQRERWKVAADAAGLSLSAWLAQAADAAAK